MFIDTHCHLNFPQYNDDRAMVIGNAKKAGVKKFINPGVDLYSSKQAIELATKHQRSVFAAIGIHPYEAQHDQDVNELEKLIKSHLSPIPASPAGRTYYLSSLIVAIGECGLDYHQYKGEQALGKKDNQKRLFADQLELALKYNLPVITHCRDAYEDFFNVLDNLPTLPQGVIHCFSGGLQDLQMAKERKFFVGIDGNVTYSKYLEMIVPQIPLSIILLETDAPFLTPVPHRGQRNEPKFISLIAKKIANLQKVPVKEVEEITSKNANLLFGIS